ncbi:hypothetical protein QE152_g27053 [Popillia japonica]|uniref:Uncharacterized protein n=1 Tax=Popillia japonica TaxID=7064 RepID=A0AAW1JUN9_POPJA
MDLYDKTFNTNVRSVFLLTNLAVPHLTESQGIFVTISSVTGRWVFGFLPAYAMSKAALDHFTSYWQVNGVSPRTVPTNLQQNAGLDNGGMNQLLEKVAIKHSFGRVGSVDEIS